MNTLWRSCQQIAFGLALLTVGALPTTAASVGRWAAMKPDWFRSDEGRQVMTNILSWQADDGAWPKDKDNSAAAANIPRDRISGTFDNGATLGELRVLAAAFRATGDLRARGFLIGGDALDRLREKQLSDLCGVPDRNGSDRARSNGAHGTLLR